MKQYPPVVRILIVILLIITVLYSIITAQDILQPLVLAMLVAFLLYPVAHQLEKWKVPRIAANIIVIALSIGLIVGIFLLIAKLFTNFLDQLPQMKEQFLQNLNRFNSFLTDKLGISAERQNQWVKKRLEQQLNDTSSMKFFTTTTSTMLKIIVLPIYTFLFLYYRDKFKTFLLKIVDNGNGRWENIIQEISKVTPRYLGGSLTVVFILAIVNSLGFWIIGLNQAILFGIIAALLNIIPYLGTVFGYGIVFLFAITTESLGIALGVAIQFSIIQFTENNLLTPNITGSRVRLNPFVVILGILIGGQIWGIAGMLVIVPVLAMLKIFFDNTENLKPLSYLMSTKGTEKHSLSGKKVMNFFRNSWKWIKERIT